MWYSSMSRKNKKLKTSKGWQPEEEEEIDHGWGLV